MREAMAYLTEILPMREAWGLLGPPLPREAYPFHFWRF